MKKTKTLSKDQLVKNYENIRKTEKTLIEDVSAFLKDLHNINLIGGKYEETRFRDGSGFRQSLIIHALTEGKMDLEYAERILKFAKQRVKTIFNDKLKNM